MADKIWHRNEIQPRKVAGIDVGSNAIRLAIARAYPNQIISLARKRFPVRLGHLVFTRGRLDQETIELALGAFREFRTLMDRHGVERYRAVATSASREAQNGKHLLQRIREESGIKVEIIDGAEEARLIHLGVAVGLNGRVSPGMIMDIGGGSLELSLLDRGELKLSASLPIGTVRLMEGMNLRGSLSKADRQKLKVQVRTTLEHHLPELWRRVGGEVVACGGNAEELARLAAGPPDRGVPTLRLDALRGMLAGLIGADVAGRMKAYGVRKDRAEVMGIAAVILQELAKWLGVGVFLVPGVGVREGVLWELMRPPGAPVNGARPEVLLREARRFARRSGCDPGHFEQVARLALSLFDQLGFLHRQGPEARILLELAAVLHDVGHFMSSTKHHKHGEYMVRHSHLAGLGGRLREMLACLVRYHTKSPPSSRHKVFAALDQQDQDQVRVLSSFLRIAEGLDHGHDQVVDQVEVRTDGNDLLLAVDPDQALGRINQNEMGKRARYLEQLFGVGVDFGARQASVA